MTKIGISNSAEDDYRLEYFFLRQTPREGSGHIIPLDSPQPKSASSAGEFFNAARSPCSTEELILIH